MPYLDPDCSNIDVDTSTGLDQPLVLTINSTNSRWVTSAVPNISYRVPPYQQVGRIPTDLIHCSSCAELGRKKESSWN